MTREDKDHLRALSICHYVLGGLNALASCCPGFYAFLGFMFIVMPDRRGNGQREVGLVFIIIFSIVMLLILALSFCLVLAGQRLQQHRSRTFCFVVAVIMCTAAPLGTILGIFTIIVLSRPSVKREFRRNDDPYEDDYY